MKTCVPLFHFISNNGFWNSSKLIYAVYWKHNIDYGAFFFANYREEADHLLGFSIQGLTSYLYFKIYRLGEQIQFENNLLGLKFS